MKKEQKRINSTVSFSSHPSFIIQSVDGTESKVHLGSHHVLWIIVLYEIRHRDSTDLSGQLSRRQAKLELVKIQKLHLSHWTWVNVLSLKSFRQIPVLSWDIRYATFQPAKFVSSFPKTAGNFNSNSWHLVVKFGHNGWF